MKRLLRRLYFWRRRRTYHEVILSTPGLVGYWPLDERS